ncbi:MAG: lipid II:glycine glycyltransferase FemX [Chloroflexota bacterium]|nr:MAG: methicillin resistance protein [Chloroflexota bacterium]
MNTCIVFDEHREGWNRFVAASRYGHILQSWEWGDIKAENGWEAVRLALLDGDSYLAAAQVLLRSLPYGLGRLAYVPKGPVLDYTDIRTVEAMLQALQHLASKRGVISLKIEPDVQEPNPVSQLLRNLGLRASAPVQMRSTIWVDLTAPEEEILAGQKQKTRYNTRLALRKGVTVSSATARDLAPWYDMYSLTAQRDGFSIHSRDYYRLLLQTLQPRGMATLLLAHHEGDLLAGIIVFSFGREAQYMYGASSNHKRNLMAPYAVQWEGMRWGKEHGAEVYDLWGIPDRLEENEELWGVYRHKRGYGGEVVRFIGAYDIVRSPVQHMALERVARPLFKRVARMSSIRANDP